MPRDYNLIAIGVDAEGRLFKAHFGMSPSYLVFNRQGELVRTVKNPYATNRTHHDDPSLITALLSDVGVFVAHRMGQASRQRLESEFKVKSFLTEEKDPQKALEAYLSQDANK